MTDYPVILIGPAGPSRVRHWPAGRGGGHRAVRGWPPPYGESRVQPCSGQRYVAAVPLKALLATVALALAGLQVLLALGMYRKLPLAASPPRPVPAVRTVTVGFAVFAARPSRSPCTA